MNHYVVDCNKMRKNDRLRSEVDITVYLESDFNAERLRADTAVAEVAALREELAKSKALSVTNILMDVVPGYDGMGEEVFAKSVAEVCEKLGEFAMQVEDLDSTTSRLHDVAILCATVEQRLTAAEQRNSELVDLLKIYPRGVPGFAEWAGKVEAALQPTESGASE